VPEAIAPGAPGLDRLERWMLRVVTHPEGVDAGFEAAKAEGLLPVGASELADVVPPNDRMSPTEQLEVYGYAYFARIIDVLAGEFPTAVELLGETEFRAAAREFLVEHPSQTWSLDRVGAPFADWMQAIADQQRDERLAATLRFCADVARVERAMDQVWDRRFEEPVPFERLQAIAQDLWPTVRLKTIAAMELLQLGHPTSEAMNAVNRGDEPELPPPETAWICVYRRGDRRFRFPIGREQHALLSALQAGETMGAAIEATATMDGADVAAMMAGLGGWFADWMASGLFCGVDSVSDPE